MADPVIQKLGYTVDETNEAIKRTLAVINKDNQINGNAIPSGAITGPKLGANSVTTGKIAPGTIEASDINQSAFDSTLQEKGKLAEAKVVGDKFKEQGDSINDLALEMANHHPQTQEAGFFVPDAQGNIGMQYNKEGLDFAKLSQHAIDVLKKNGIGDTTNVVQTQEKGFFIVDSRLNIGMSVDEKGVHSKNIIEFEFVNY